MTINTPISGSTPRPIWRFPRLPGDREVAELAQQVWRSPTFTAKDVHGMTQFIFSVPIRSGFKRQNPSIYRSLFKAKRVAWTSALEQAYPGTRSGKKLVKDYIDTLLYKLFYEALLILNTDTEGLTGDYTKFKKDFADNFRAASPRTPGRRSDPNKDKREIRLAERYAILLLRMKELRKVVNLLKQSGISQENLVRERVVAEFKDDWITFVVSGAAFEMLLGGASQEGIVKNGSIAGRWAPWQLTLSVIRCEENARKSRKPVSLHTIRKAIMRGTSKLRGNSTK
jgi:hypothetical protein